MVAVKDPTTTATTTTQPPGKDDPKSGEKENAGATFAVPLPVLPTSAPDDCEDLSEKLPPSKGKQIPRTPVKAVSDADLRVEVVEVASTPEKEAASKLKPPFKPSSALQQEMERYPSFTPSPKVRKKSSRIEEAKTEEAHEDEEIAQQQQQQQQQAKNVIPKGSHQIPRTPFVGGVSPPATKVDDLSLIHI